MKSDDEIRLLRQAEPRQIRGISKIKVGKIFVNDVEDMYLQRDGAIGEAARDISDVMEAKKSNWSSHFVALAGVFGGLISIPEKYKIEFLSATEFSAGPVKLLYLVAIGALITRLYMDFKTRLRHKAPKTRRECEQFIVARIKGGSEVCNPDGSDR